MMEQLDKVIVGQKEVLELILSAIFTRGHCLLIGVPGLAKTLMVSSIAQILDVGFKRIQFTPDLMPSDITGTTVLEEDESRRRSFRFVQGPVFTNILLADEINRTPPKTQAALLQAMQEREVSAGQDTHKLPDPFFVIATQNPIEQEGTYPLPEAQLDRFMFTIKVDYPTFDEEKKIISTRGKAEKEELKKVLSVQSILNMQTFILTHAVAGESMQDYIVRLVRATRPKDPTAPDFVRRMVDFGGGPRAGLYIRDGAKASAILAGRLDVTFEDIKKVAVPVLRHRIGTNFQAQAEGMTSEDIIAQLLAAIPERDAPRYQKTR
jgi:MoxR-like ATPase